MTQPGSSSIDTVLEEVRRKLDFQFAQLDGLDIKASIVLAVAGVLLTLFLTNPSREAFAGTNLYLTGAALVLIMVAVVLSFGELWIKKYDRPPNVERLHSHYMAKDAGETKLSIINTCLRDYVLDTVS